MFIQLFGNKRSIDLLDCIDASPVQFILQIFGTIQQSIVKTVYAL